MALTKEDLIGRLLAATPHQLQLVESALIGATPPTENTDRRLFSVAQTARELGVSRASVHRWINAGKLPTVETSGNRRIPSAALTALAAGKGVA